MGRKEERIERLAKAGASASAYQRGTPSWDSLPEREREQHRQESREMMDRLEED